MPHHRRTHSSEPIRLDQGRADGDRPTPIGMTLLAIIPTLTALLSRKTFRKRSFLEEPSYPPVAELLFIKKSSRHPDALIQENDFLKQKPIPMVTSTSHGRLTPSSNPSERPGLHQRDTDRHLIEKGQRRARASQASCPICVNKMTTFLPRLSFSRRRPGVIPRSVLIPSAYRISSRSTDPTRQILHPVSKKISIHHLPLTLATRDADYLSLVNFHSQDIRSLNLPA